MLLEQREPSLSLQLTDIMMTIEDDNPVGMGETMEDCIIEEETKLVKKEASQQIVEEAIINTARSQLVVIWSYELMPNLRPKYLPENVERK